MAWRLPLAVVLGLQVLIAALIAVILVISEQQKSEFRKSLYEQLAPRQRYVMDAVTNPLIQRMAAFDFAVESYMEGTNGDRQFAAPSDNKATSSPFGCRFSIISIRSSIRTLPFR